MFADLASIGLKELVPALGLRDNCKEYISRTSSGSLLDACSSCAHKTGSAVCSNCPAASGKMVYINEKHRYGEKHPLKKYALLMYMLFHFMQPDELGHVSKIDPSEISGMLGCSIRTVRNNLSLLSKYGYISVSPDNIDGYYQLFIKNYRDMYKPAPSGGRGFIRMQASFLDKLSALPDVNNIRLAVRALIFNSEYRKEDVPDLEKSYRKIKSFLPSYVTFRQLNGMLDNNVFKTLFNVTRRSRSAAIVITDEFNPVSAAEKIRSECRKEIEICIEQINKPLKGKGNKTLGNLLHLTDKELRDVANISLRYPVKAVIEGIKKFYESYIAVNLRYRSAGALIRSYASDYAAYGYIPT